MKASFVSSRGMGGAALSEVRPRHCLVLLTKHRPGNPRSIKEELRLRLITETSNVSETEGYV